ncbi:unnamed protein product [Mytilus edulis]|uniref:Uncharacterized protein n=1 Tax=Mytilus edulis TaxID=6550 RepID=A0A8S3SYI9_MYTED|nr:unnamed protein product [Mytilus edulis]
MGKSRAEIQKAYRDRKKEKDGNAYLQKERERVKRYYVDTSALSKKKLEQRRTKIRQCMAKKRAKDKVPQNDKDEVPECSTRSNTQQQQQPPMLVKLNFPLKSRSKIQTRKRTSRAVAKANYKINKMTQKIQELKRRNWTITKRLQRRMARENKDNKNNLEKTITSPMRKANQDLREANLSPTKYPDLQKKLTYHNCLISEIKESVSHEKNKFPVLQVITGKAIRDHKCIRRLSYDIKVNRKQLMKIKSKREKEKKKTRMKAAREDLRSKVLVFLERDDNSTCLPGKRDNKKDGKEKKQKRVLNDYLDNLHQKFLSENVLTKLSVSVFRRFRPANYVLASFGNRRTCLCQRHQNMALKVRTLKALNITTTSNPDQLIRQMTDEEVLAKITELEDEKIKYSEWKRVDVEEKGMMKKRMNVVQCEANKQEFGTLIRTSLNEFRAHVYRVQTQYEQIRTLKENLAKYNVICQMDFAENYSCVHADEVQSAYFDKASVTLHPVVLYYKVDGDINLHHKSFVFVSDEPGHNSSTVYAFIKDLIPKILQIAPGTKAVHYITDSPTSQYRNKYIFHLVTLHGMLFDGITASWHYFEAGHGKGPCDGVGGTAKRLADMAVRQQKVVIQTPVDFFNWGKSQETSNITYIFVPKSKCQSANNEMKEWNAVAVKGTMELHAVVPITRNVISIRNTSCFCLLCFSGGRFHPACDGWRSVSLEGKQKRNAPGTETNEIELQANDPQEEEVERHVEGGESLLAQPPIVFEQSYQKDTFVASVYDNVWYICKVLDFDNNDNEYQLSFMTKSNPVSHTMKWPTRPEELWVTETDIVCQVNNPAPVGRKPVRMYKLLPDDVNKIESLL